MRRLADEYPEQGDARYALALTAVMAKRYELAEGDVQLLLQQEPHNVKAAVLLSRIRAARDDKAGAEEVLRGMVERYPDDAELRTTYARFLMENDRKEDAYKQYLVLRKLDAEDGDVHFFLGILALQMERREDAVAHLRDLYGLGKRKDEAAYYLGWIAEEAGRPEQAREWLQRVGEGELQIEAQTRLARMEAKEGRLNQAREILQRLRVDAPDSAGELYLVEVELLKKYAPADQVLDAYAVALSERPDDEDLLYSRAMFYVAQNELGKMEADLRAILEKNPDNADALNGLGYVLADQTDRLHEALRLHRKGPRPGAGFGRHPGQHGVGAVSAGPHRRGPGVSATGLREGERRRDRCPPGGGAVVPGTQGGGAPGLEEGPGGEPGERLPEGDHAAAGDP
jgi:predicted Zn-dependent protease